MTAARLDAGAVAALALLASSAVRALVVAVAAGLVLAALRARRASIQLAGWRIVMGAAIAMPVLGWMLPSVRWSVPIVLPPTEVRAAQAAGVHSATPDEEPPHEGGARRSSVPVAPGDVPQRTSVTNADAPTASNGPDRARVSLIPAWPVGVFLVYLCGVMVLLLRAGAGWLMAHRLRRSAHPITDGGALARLRAAAATGGLNGPPQLAEADALVVPITMSVLRPVILLPATWRAWDSATLDAVLTHEVAHVARRDTLTQHLSLIYRAIFWFSPLGWWLRRTLANMAEHASDEAVLAAGADRTAYAETVLGFFAALRADPRRAHWPAIAMARGTGASRRVERILAWTGTGRRTLARPAQLTMTFVAGVVIVLAATVRPVATSSLSVPAALPIADAVVPFGPRRPSPVPPSASNLAARISPAPAKTSAPQSDGRSVRIDTVRVDVIARDAQGRAVTDLKAEDLRIFEDGVEQKIDAFAPMVIQRAPSVGGIITPSADKSGSGRAFVVVIDDLNIAPADIASLRRTLETIRDQLLHDGDLVSVVSTGDSSIQVDLTYDPGHARFNAAIARIASRAQAPPPTQARSDDSRRYMAHTAMKTAYDIVQTAGQMTDRRTAMIFISGGNALHPAEGAPHTQGSGIDASAGATGNPFAKSGSQFTDADLGADLAALIRAAIRATVTFYVFNTGTGAAGASGMFALTSDAWPSYVAATTNSLRALAESTGGLAYVDAFDPARRLVPIDNETDTSALSYYLIAYTTTNHDETKVVRQIEVRAVRPGLTLEYRRNYFFKK